MGRPVTQWQILSKDPEACARFYSALFGWSVNADNPLGYRRVDTGSERGISGGIWPAPPQAQSFVQLFVEVDDIAAGVERAKGLGATVLIPPQRLPEGDQLAILRDVEGMSFGLMQPAAK
jgi:predicted enzyme related to lactoylglutathione lyase